MVLTQHQNKEAFWGDKLTIDGLRISKKPAAIPMEFLPPPTVPTLSASESSLAVPLAPKALETTHSHEEPGPVSEVDAAQEEMRAQLYRQRIVLTLLREGLEDVRRKAEQRRLSKSSAHASDAVTALDSSESTHGQQSSSTAVVIDAPVVTSVPAVIADQPAVDVISSRSDPLCGSNHVLASEFQHDTDNMPAAVSAVSPSFDPVPVPESALDEPTMSAPVLAVVDDSKVSRVKRLLHTYMDTVAKTDKREKRKAQKLSDGVDHTADDEGRSKRVRTHEAPLEKSLDELLLPSLMEQMLAFLKENPRACLPCSKNRAGCLLSERNRRAREEQLDGDEWIPSLDDDPW